MKRLKFYRKIISNSANFEDGTMPIIFHAMDKSGQAYLLKSDLTAHKGYEEDNILKLAATMRIAFSLYDIVKYVIFFPIKHQGTNLVITAEVSPENTEAIALKLTNSLPKFEGFDITDTKSGIFLGLLSVDYNDRLNKCIETESPELVKDIGILWNGMKFTLEVIEPNFAELKAALSS